MDYEEFVTIVRTAAAIDRESAERATSATLQTLAQGLTRGGARHVVAELPPGTRPAFVHRRASRPVRHRGIHPPYRQADRCRQGTT